MSSIRVIFMVALFGGIGLHAQPASLAFKPIAIDYSKSLDRLVMVSVNPNRVHLVNPATLAVTTVNLNLTPLSLSVSPDGTHAAVGHDGWISYVNLTSAYVEKNLAVSVKANSLLLSGSGTIWVPPTTTVNIATGSLTNASYLIWGPALKPTLHPNGIWTYYTRSGSPDDVIKGDLSSGTFQYLYDSRYHGDFAVCGDIFYSADGNRLLTGCGTFFRTTNSATDDITYSGALSAAPSVIAATDSLVTRKFAVIPGINSYSTPASTDTEIQLYDSEFLTFLGRVPLPKISANVPWRGRQLFYSPDATKLYLVLQADATASLINDYAIYTLTLSTGSGCNSTLGATSGNVAAGSGRVEVNVTATAGCVWQASSNTTWLNVGVGGVSSGSGAVTIHAGPNLQTVSRTGTVTIAGLTYTVIQAAAVSAGVNPVTLSPVRPIAADYSVALDRMVLVSANPNTLTILDPVTGNSQVVSLAMPPTALSISPDGMRAAVGHDGRVSYVNLSTASVERIFPVTTTVFDLALSANDIFAFPLRDQWSAIRVINLATGTEALWNWIYAGSNAGKISPNGKYLYISATKRYDITQPLPSAFDAISSYSPRQWFSQDGSRLFGGSGQIYRLSDSSAQDLQYSGRFANGSVTAVADSSIQGVTATVSTGATLDTSINFYSQQYLAVSGSITLPKVTVGANSFDAHGRHLFWNAAGSRLFSVVQADPSSGLLNDYFIYTVNLGASCNTSLDKTSVSTAAAGGNAKVIVTANAGCAWKASSNAAWLTITTNSFSAGSATVDYIVDANPTTNARTATITVDSNKTLTVTQAAGTQAVPAVVNGLPFRVIDAEYSSALDRIVALSSNPSRLNIYNPASATNISVTLPLPGNAVTVAPSGLRAAACHDGLVSVINLQSATLEKTLNVSVSCADIVMADNNYVYLSAGGGWGSASSVNIATGVETKIDLLYDGTNFRLNQAGDAIYTTNTATSSQAVSRYKIAAGPMQKDYASEVYPTHAPGTMLWFTRDGRMAGNSGKIFRAGSSLSTDFIYTGTLSGHSAYAGYGGAIGSLAHSTSRAMFASIAGSNSSATPPTDLYLHGDKYLALASRVILPKLTIGSVSASSQGKFVFWDNAGLKAYVIMQADPTVGILNDFAVYTLSPEFTPGCPVSLGISSGTAIAFPDTGGVAVDAAVDCVWEVKSNAPWILIDTGTLGVGTGNVGYSVLTNPATTSRSGTITIGSKTFTLTQAAAASPTCTVTLGANSVNAAANGEAGAVSVGIASGCAWAASSNAAWIQVSSGANGVGPGSVSYTVAANPNAATRTGTITISTLTFTINQAALPAVPPPSGGGTPIVSQALRFVSLTPCRIADTRLAQGPFGGPSITGGTSRSFAPPASACNVPSNAQAYSLNVTVVPRSGLGYLTIWPTGQAQPFVSTLNSIDGRIKANAAIVPAGSNGSVSVFVTDTTEVILDINGYFVPATVSDSLAFYPVQPCRVADTRLASGPFGGPALAAGASRDFSVTSSSCNIPPSAKAYSVNMTVVPSEPLGHLTTWPAGATRPIVSTLNAPTGTVVANAAIIPASASAGGAISVYVTNRTDLIIDINGYFAPPGISGAQSFYAVSPCRILDTRLANGPLGGPVLEASESRSFQPTAATCGLPGAAQGYSLNATVVPPGFFAFLTLWPSGQTRPTVSTLNSYDGAITSNAVILPAGSAGAVSAFVASKSQLVLDVNGFFAP